MFSSVTKKKRTKRDKFIHSLFVFVEWLDSKFGGSITAAILGKRSFRMLKSWLRAHAHKEVPFLYCPSFIFNTSSITLGTMLDFLFWVGVKELMIFASCYTRRSDFMNV